MKAEIAFLSEFQVRPALQELLKNSESADIAVAYWGEGASNTLGISAIAGKVRIVCDAESGACNPAELRRLLGMKNVELKTRPGLHAKVFLAGTCVAIGSANASANGLGDEGEDANNLEAVVIIPDKNCRAVAQSWFESLWRDSRCVRDGLIERILPIWRERRRARSAGNVGKSLLRVLDDEPLWFKDREIRIVAYRGTDASPAAVRKFDTIAPGLYESRKLDKYRKFKALPFYEDDGTWNIRAGEYIIDFHVNEDRATFQGLWRVRSQDPFHPIGKKHTLILCDEVKDFKRLRLSTSDGRRLGTRVFQYVASRKFEQDPHGSMMDLPLDRAAFELPVAS